MGDCIDPFLEATYADDYALDENRALQKACEEWRARNGAKRTIEIIYVEMPDEEPAND